MKRYLIQSPRYTGSVEVIYNNGILQVLDISNTNMARPSMIEAFIKKVSVEECYLANGWVDNVTIIPADVEITFKMFWDKYNNKVNKLRATKIWERMPLAEQVAAYCNIQKYFTYLKKNDWRGQQDPDTYLRNKTYLNEYKEAPIPTNYSQGPQTNEVTNIVNDILHGKNIE
jgi:hypothetical protein